MNTISDRLRWLLEHYRVSARGLSIKAGLSPNAVQKVLERGGSANVDTMAPIADVLGCSLDWLIAGKGEPPASESMAADVREAQSTSPTTAAA